MKNGTKIKTNDLMLGLTKNDFAANRNLVGKEDDAAEDATL